jgi:CRP-like cAMP-binding protein
MATLMESGKEFTSSLYHVGEAFGELGLAGEPYRVDMAISCEKTVLIGFKCEVLTDFLKQNLLFTLRFMQLIGSRRHESENKLLQFFYTPVHSRLAKLLIHFAAKHAKTPLPLPFQLRLTHEVLASLAGTTRETTTMILNRFEKMGMIHKSKGSIFIKDLQSLQAFCHSRTPLEENKAFTLPHAI